MKKSVATCVILAAFAALASHAGGVISINIAGDGLKMSEQSGTAPGLSGFAGVTAASWNDIVGTSSAEATALRAWDSENGTVTPSELTATWSFSGVWGTGSSPDIFRRRWSNTAGAGAWSMSISGIPYGKYDVVCYFNWDGSHGWSPINVNGADWTSDAKGNGVKGSDYWGVTTADVSNSSELGKNAMRIKDLTGSTLALSGAGYCNVCAIQIVDADVEPPPVVVEDADVISINFAGSYATVSDRGGALPGLSGFAGVTAGSWNDIVDKSSSEPLALKAWSAGSGVVSPSGLTATWSVAGFWHQDSSPDAFRRAFANAAGAGEWSLNISGIPFENYSVILYSNYDGVPSYGWGPLKLNGQNWTCDAKGVGVAGSSSWGTTVNDSSDPAIFGQNAMRVGGLSGSTLAIASGSPWCNASAIQIVRESPIHIHVDGDITTSKINALAGGKSSVSILLPAGARLTLMKAGLTCAELHVSCTGDCMIDTDYDPTAPEFVDRFDATMKKISTAEVKGTVFHGWKAAGRVISVNVYSEKGEMTGLSGFAGAFAGEEIPASSWNDMPAANMTGEGFAPKVWNGKELSAGTVDGLTMSWDFVNVYGWGNSPDFFRRGWLTQGANPWVITFEGIPFAKYDVICYFNWDGVAPFWANQINGVYYIGDENGVAQEAVYGATWGESGHSEAAQMGRNAYRLKDQTSPKLTLSGAWMANLCAIQIVEPAKKRKYYKPLVLTIR